MQGTVDTMCSEDCINLVYSYLNKLWEVNGELIQVLLWAGENLAWLCRVHMDTHCWPWTWGGWIPRLMTSARRLLILMRGGEVFECYLLSLLVESDSDAPQVYFSLSPFCHQCLCLITVCVLNSWSREILPGCQCKCDLGFNSLMF